MTLLKYILKIIVNLHFLPGRLHQKLYFKKNHGYSPNLTKPSTLNEKIIFLKLNNKENIHTTLSDKWAVKNYLKGIIDNKYLIPNLKISTHIKSIKFDELIYPCVIKSNGGSGDFHLLKEKPKELEIKNIYKKFSYGKYRSLYLEKKEWQYKNIPYKILVEPMLLDKNKNIPPDYKIHFFNGHPEFIYVTTGREKKTIRGVYDLEWNPLPFIWSKLDLNGKPIYEFDSSITKPKNLKEILELSSQIAQLAKAPYVRIDLFNIDEEKIKFGEVTFHHMSGMAPIIPLEWDFKLGKRLVL